MRQGFFKKSKMFVALFSDLLDLIRILGLQNRIFAQLWMQAGPSGGLGPLAAKPVKEG